MAAQTLYSNALPYIEMYHSPAGWKRKSSALAEFSKLTSKSAKIEAAKEQIRIRILGFGWNDLHYAWSKNGIDRSPEELLTYLTNVLIPQQSERGIPEKPKITLPSREDNKPRLGTITRDISVLE